MPVQHDSRNLFLDGPAGRLEAILWTPKRPDSPPLAAVICHPHPVFGGTMHNKVVYQAAKSMDALGVPVLRFNFRGAGLSAGLHDHGQGEQGDVEAAIEFLASACPKAGLLMAGFSFGSWVGLRVGCAEARVIELIGMGLPVNNSDFSYLSRCVKSKLIVQGTSDEHGAWKDVERVMAIAPGSNRVEFVEGADHFFSGRLDELDRAIREWLVEQHPELRRSRGYLPDGHPLP